MTEPSDATLVRQAQSGSREEAFARLYERHKDAVFGFLVRVLRDRSLAEDVLQETFYRLYRSLDRIDADRPFKPYLHQVVRRATIDALAARKNERAAGKLEPATAAEEPRAASERREEEDRARDAYAALPEETRLLLHQRHGLDMKLEDLAVAWEVTERTVRNRLKDAARELVRVFYERRGGRP